VLLLIVVAVVVTAVAAYIDYRTGFIPNVLTIGAFVFAFTARAGLALFHGGAGAVPASLASAAIGAIVCAIAPLVLYRVHALGGGDVKLFIALGALLGPLAGMHTEMTAFVCGAFIAPLRLAFNAGSGEALAHGGSSGAVRVFAMLRRSFAIAANVVLPRSRRVAIDEAAMTWFRFGPAIFAGTTLSIVLRWGELA
jgi:prepilin peptidase CpaA